MTAHWAEQYVTAGLRWSELGCGPLHYTCWAFACEVQREVFRRELPALPIGDRDGVLRVLANSDEMHAWHKRVDLAAADGDLVLMQGMDLHIGVWADVDGGGVLHCARGLDVVFSPPELLEMHGFRIVKVWRHG